MSLRSLVRQVVGDLDAFAGDAAQHMLPSAALRHCSMALMTLICPWLR
ncbi:MAG: hypothetical protein WC100_14250 [Sterolibacterium sp.]